MTSVSVLSKHSISLATAWTKDNPEPYHHLILTQKQKQIIFQHTEQESSCVGVLQEPIAVRSMTSPLVVYLFKGGMAGSHFYCDRERAENTMCNADQRSPLRTQIEAPRFPGSHCNRRREENAAINSSHAQDYYIFCGPLGTIVKRGRIDVTRGKDVKTLAFFLLTSV